MRLADRICCRSNRNFFGYDADVCEGAQDVGAKSRDEIVERNRELEEGYCGYDDPRVKSVPPTKDDAAILNFAPLDNARVAGGRCRAGI